MVTFEDSSPVRTRLWRDGKLAEENYPLATVSDYLQEPDALVWVDFCDPTHTQLLALAEELEFDPHAVEDALAHGERTKATRYATHTFLTVYATHLHPEPEPGAEAHESRLHTTRISAFIVPRGMVTVRRGSPFDIDEVVRRWDENADLLKHGPGALVHGLLDTVVDGQFDTIQELDDTAETLEDDLFEDNVPTRLIQRRVYRLRKELVQLRRVVLPMREVVNTVLRHRAEHGNSVELDSWYTDLYDHVIRATEWSDSLRDMVTTVFETNLSLQDAHLNTIMKKLTSWAAIIAVPTAVTGWYGMNVPYPGFGQWWGVLTSAGVVFGAAAMLYVTFKRRDWL
ncbi:magnesium transporter CorA family protein [Rhodococcus chondri]|uniref:Magnesium transporter CorA family protein n=1 Tax=Rhodococcus chondri TaxID=3065941 RepID=A0ABU7JPD9_9NOCA|nr:magnesium transporter CorA family protein [Rhodococcus sp. CC-R104]MEE2031896.1 magnesium transporter CorA family protein [Rhodococcus sp. CC-R104]